MYWKNVLRDSVIIIMVLFFYRRIYGVNFERINNGPQYQIDNFDDYCERNFQKSLKLVYVIFLWPSITALARWKRKKKNYGFSLVNLAGNAPYILISYPGYKQRGLETRSVGRTARPRRSNTERTTNGIWKIKKKNKKKIVKAQFWGFFTYTLPAKSWI